MRCGFCRCRTRWHALRAASLSCFTFAQVGRRGDRRRRDVAGAGPSVGRRGRGAARFAPVLAVDSPQLAHPLAEPFARAIAAVVEASAVRPGRARRRRPSPKTCCRGPPPCWAARWPATSCAMNWSTAGLQFDCPQFAGAVTATFDCIGSPQIVTRARLGLSGRDGRATAAHPIERIELDAATFACRGASTKG